MQEIGSLALFDELSMHEAARAIDGLDPFVPRSDADPDTPTEVALKRAIESRQLPAFMPRDHASEAEDVFDTQWNLVTIKIDALKKWLGDRGVRPACLFPELPRAPDYLSKEHKRYSPKLAAAVSAWIAVEGLAGTSAKQALEKWLRLNGDKFGLVHEDGKVNETGVAECAKVANWDTAGGAPKTPGREPPPP